DLLATGFLEELDQGLGGLLGAGGQPQARRTVGAPFLPLQDPAPTGTGEFPRVIDDGGARPVQCPHLPMAASVQPNSLRAGARWARAAAAVLTGGGRCGPRSRQPVWSAVGGGGMRFEGTPPCGCLRR